MTTAYWCVLAAALVPYFTVAVAKSKGDFDNAAPRDWLARQEGFRKRALWAHQNAFEAFGPFAAAVIIAQLAKHVRDGSMCSPSPSCSRGSRTPPSTF